MTSGERRRCMFLLRRAQAGDDTAFGPLTEAIAEHFRYMIRGYAAVDPAYDREDLLSAFREGIWQAIRKVDGRGDPLYHLAERGRWQVASLLAAVKVRRQGTAKWIEEHGERSIGCIPEGFDVPDPDPVSDPAYALEIRIERDNARRRVVYILSNVDLIGRDRDVLTWMLVDPEPEGKGANVRLAQRLGVTEQRASVLRRRVTEKLAST